MQVVIIGGTGLIGRKLAAKLEAGGHEVVAAAPSTGVNSLTGDGLDGKTLIDVTNALDGNMNLALGFTTSGAEELQRKVPKAKVVKAFNTVFAKHMDTGRLGDEPLTAFVAGDDADAKQEALTLARDIGFDAVDAGPLKNARLIEPLGYLNIQLGYGQKMGRDIGIDLRRA